MQNNQAKLRQITYLPVDLKAMRCESNLTLREMCKILNIDPSNYSKIERGLLPLTEELYQEISKVIRERLEGKQENRHNQAPAQDNKGENFHSTCPDCKKLIPNQHFDCERKIKDHAEARGKQAGAEIASATRQSNDDQLRTFVVALVQDLLILNESSSMSSFNVNKHNQAVLKLSNIK